MTKATFNNAEVVNRGVELTVGSDQRVVGSLRWKGTLSYAYNYNKVETYNVNTAYSPGFNHGYVAGYPKNFQMVMRSAGYTSEGFIVLQGKDGEQSVFKDNASGHQYDQIYRNLGQTIDDNNWYYYLGSLTPSHNASLTNQFTWRGLTLQVMLTGRFGYWVERNDYFTTQINEASFSRQLDQSFRVLDQGYATQTSYSAMPLFTDGNAAVFGRMCLYAQAQDLGIIWKRSHDMDPDYPVGTLKPMPSFTLGLRINFKN